MSVQRGLVVLHAKLRAKYTMDKSPVHRSADIWCVLLKQNTPVSSETPANDLSTKKNPCMCMFSFEFLRRLLLWKAWFLSYTFMFILFTAIDSYIIWYIFDPVKSYFSLEKWYIKMIYSNDFEITDLSFFLKFSKKTI